MPRIQFKQGSNATPPVKIDGKVYSVLHNTYQRMLNEKQTVERYTSNGSIDFQKQNTHCHRWQMTLIVPLSSSYVTLSTDCPVSINDIGTLADLQASDDKVAPSSQMQFYDIENEWDFSGTYNYLVYMTRMDNTQPYHDVYKWQVPISLWGYDAE